MIGAVGFGSHMFDNLYNNHYLQSLIQNREKDKLSEIEIRQKKRTGEIECQTCAGRRYVDRSNDPGVSFKTPTKISSSQSAQMVMSHELEHAARESAKATRENRRVIFSSITTMTAVCPECGAMYTSGGVTRTVTENIPEDESLKDNFDKALGIGAAFDKNA